MKKIVLGSILFFNLALHFLKLLFPPYSTNIQHGLTNVFFVNSEDYEACINAFNKYEFDKDLMKIIKVSTFDEILSTLENWGE